MKKPRRPLPPSCSQCRPYNGLYRNWGTDDAVRLARCDCPRGKALAMGPRWGKPAKKKPAPAADGKHAATGGDE